MTKLLNCNLQKYSYMRTMLRHYFYKYGLIDFTTTVRYVECASNMDISPKILLKNYLRFLGVTTNFIIIRLAAVIYLIEER